MMDGFVAVDVETSGLDPRKHEIIELALVKDRGSGPEVFECSLPFHADVADPAALAVNGAGKREFAPVMDPLAVALTVAGATEGCYLIGKNPAFDTGFLRELLAAHGLRPSWHHRLIDVGALAWGWHNGQAELSDKLREPPSTHGVAELVGIERQQVGGFHTATLDAEWAYQVFLRVMG